LKEPDVIDAQSNKFFKAESPACAQDHYVFRYFITKENIHPLCHNGFVHCLLLTEFNKEKVIISAGSDGCVKFWTADLALRNLAKIECGEDAIYSLAYSEEMLFIGLQGGGIKILDVETRQIIRSIKAHNDDIFTMACTENYLISGSMEGTIKLWSLNNLHCEVILDSHSDSILNLHSKDYILVSSSKDSTIKLWRIDSPFKSPIFRQSSFNDLHDNMYYGLKKFIEHKSVSADPDSRGCLSAAKFLKDYLISLGIESRLISGSEFGNPAVFGHVQSGNPNSLNVLFYGHYDVTPAKEDSWDSDPFVLTGKDGYYYGRGVTDNKGPILAFILAVSRLMDERNLKCNVYFLIEGEEEIGSKNLEAIMRHNSDLFPSIDLLVLR
jgi:di- and tripeptidase